MEDGVVLVQKALREVLVKQQEMLTLAVRGRAGFEAWLKWEVTAWLNRARDARVEDLRRPELAFTLRGERYFVKITSFAPTSAHWKRRLRKDIEKVTGEVRPPHRWGMVAFCLFPVRERLVTTPASILHQQLEDVEEAGRLSKGTLPWEFLPVPDLDGSGVVLGVAAPFKTEFQRVLDRIVQGYQPREVYLYGSFAGGNGNPDLDSDFDLLVVRETPERPLDRRVALARLIDDRRRRVPVEVLVLTPAEMADRRRAKDPFIEGIVERGVVLYAR